MKITYFSNSQKFLYDFQHIIRAFYPGDEVKFGHGGDIHLEAWFDEFEVFLKLQKENKTVYYKSFYLAEDYHESKRIFGRNIYDLLKEETKKELPWGILTGIRPTKIVYPLLQQGLDTQQIYHFLKNEYYISDKKAKLLVEVAKNETEVLDRLEPFSACLYIGIPICPTKCLYCSFSSHEMTKQVRDLIGMYTDALIFELGQTYQNIKKNRNKIVSVYFGGGSPAVLGIEGVKRIFENILENLEKEHIKEVTFEAGRPDTISEELLDYLSDMNRYLNIRLCINPQTSNDRTLRLIGRNHTFDDIKRAFYMARRYEFENINSDIILGLPNENEEDYKKTVEDVLNLSPASITVHTLAIKRASLLRFKWNEYRFMDEETVNDLLDWTYFTLQQHGYIPYYMYRQKNMIGNFENVGYCKRGFEGIYNVMIMQEKHNIYACGAKAVSKFVYEEDRIERVFNPADIKLYISRMLNVDIT